MASTLPTLQKTWTVVANQTVASAGTVDGDTSNLMLLIISQLITWGWTVVGSGSTAYGGGANDSVNRITTTANFSNSCWITLSNSTMGISLQIQKNSSTDGLWNWRASYAGFTGGTPSATVAGTAADSFICNLTVGLGYPFIGNAFATTCKWHGWKSSDNYVHDVIVYVSSVPVFRLRVEKSANAPTGFPAAVVAVLDQGNGSGTNRLLVGGINWYAWYAASKRTLQYMQACIGTTAVQGMTVSVFDNNYMISPVGVASTTAAVLGMGFWNADLYLIASSLQEGTAFPATGARTWVVCGDFLLPWTDVAMQIT
jgi:hypothetical protein